MMKTINNYIFEKLKINKDVKSFNDNQNDIFNRIIEIINWECYENIINKNIKCIIKEWIMDNNVNKILTYTLKSDYLNFPKKLFDMIDHQIYRAELEDILNKHGYNGGYNIKCHQGDKIYMNVFYNKDIIYIDCNFFDFLVLNESNKSITEKLKIDKDVELNKVFLLLFEYDFENDRFVWDTFDNIGDAFKGMDDHDGIYDVYLNVPNDKDFIKSFLQSCKDIKFGDISYEKFNGIMNKNGIKGLSAETMLDLHKKWKKRMKKENA